MDGPLLVTITDVKRVQKTNGIKYKNKIKE